MIYAPGIPPDGDSTLRSWLRRELANIAAAINTPAPMVWRGTWAAGRYQEGNVVVNSGSAYTALRETTGTPGVSADWEALW